MSTSAIWVIIISIGLGTFLLRASFIWLEGRFAMPSIFRRGLRFVPITALTALVVPALLFQTGQLNLSLSNDRLLAGLTAAAVAFLTRNVLLTIGVGMVALWTLQAFTN